MFYFTDLMPQIHEHAMMTRAFSRNPDVFPDAFLPW